MHAHSFLCQNKFLTQKYIIVCMKSLYIVFLNSIDFSIPKEDANKHMNLLIMKCVQAYCLMVNLCIFP